MLTLCNPTLKCLAFTNDQPLYVHYVCKHTSKLFQYVYNAQLSNITNVGHRDYINIQMMYQLTAYCKTGWPVTI